MKKHYNFKSSLILLLLVLAGATGMGQVTTDYVINITDVSAFCAYTISSGSGSNAKGIFYSIYSVNPDPQFGGTGVATVPDGSGDGSFTLQIGSQAVPVFTPNTKYALRAYGYNGTSYTYGLVIVFTTYPSGTSSNFPYQCMLKNDYLIDANTLQFDVWIYRTGGAAANYLYLNNYQLGFEVHNVGTTPGTLTGTTISSALPSGFQPATNLIFRVDGTHFDAVIPGPSASGNGTLISVDPGIRIGTFQIVHKTSGTPSAFPSGVQLNMTFDNDVLGKTVIYAITPAGITGTPLNATNFSSHLPNELNLNHYFPSNNYMCQALNWNGANGTDWVDPLNWFRNPDTLARPPHSASYVYIEGGATVTNFPVVITRTTPRCGTLNIDDGAKVTIASNGDIKVYGNLLIGTTASGPLLIQSDVSGTGSLVVTGTVTGTGIANAKIERYITGSSDLNAMMYHLVSIPLTPATSSTSNLFLGSYLYDFTESTNSWHYLGESTSTALDETRGYMIYYPGASTKYTFTGELNNGTFSALTTMAGTGYNLVPNPYPSAIDWNAVSGWTKTNIGGTIYFWQAGTAATGNYATWNGTSGTLSGTRYIPSGQSFFVLAGSSPALSMNNSVRVNNTQAFWKSTESIANLIKIKSISQSNNAIDELIVHFREGATEGFDTEFDAYKMQGGTNAPQISTVAIDNSLMTINSLPPLSSGEVVVPINFTFNGTSEVTFTASGIESIPANTPIYLEDITLSKLVNLRTNPEYTFNYDPSTSADRFKLHFAGTNGMNDLTAISGKVFISDGQIFIDVPDMEGKTADISVYNLLGQNILTEYKTMNGVISVKSPSNFGVYVVKVSSDTQNFTAKIVNK